MSITMNMVLEKSNGSEDICLVISHLIIAGWTGRDNPVVERRKQELEVLGIKSPAQVPVYCDIAVSRLTTLGEIETSGAAATGEVEVVLIEQHGKLYVGLGSDHTDRELEKTALSLSKQICEKPIANSVWLYEDVFQHWDMLELRCWLMEGRKKKLYQHGMLSELLQPLKLLTDLRARRGALEGGLAVFCGTFAAIGGVRFAQCLTLELHDPVLQRTLSHVYRVHELPVVI
ncbi:MAG: DUF2848 family protein [Gammaproteobacteria bacterium]